MIFVEIVSKHRKINIPVFTFPNLSLEFHNFLQPLSIFPEMLL